MTSSECCMDDGQAGKMESDASECGRGALAAITSTSPGVNVKNVALFCKETEPDAAMLFHMAPDKDWGRGRTGSRAADARGWGRFWPDRIKSHPIEFSRAVAEDRRFQGKVLRNLECRIFKPQPDWIQSHPGFKIQKKLSLGSSIFKPHPDCIQSGGGGRD